VLSETLEVGLRRYEIGAKIKALRLQKKLGLVQLGEHSGLSPGLLSKIERSQIFPTLPTLLRIALVFGVGLDHFFAESSDRPTIAVVRKNERIRLPAEPGQTAPVYFFESLDYPVTDRVMEAYLAEFETESGATEPHEHVGAEIIYVIGGALTLNVAGEDVELSEGDSVYFDSSYPHSYRHSGKVKCTAIVVVTGRLDQRRAD
jgi:transcriptional regulator with XRE-family HTH domain